MNSALYVPDPKKWVKYFEKKPSDILKVDNSTITLTSPIQSVVERAKSELERINAETPSTSIITTSATNKYGPKRDSTHVKKLTTKQKKYKTKPKKVGKLNKKHRRKTRKLLKKAKNRTKSTEKTPEN